MFITRIAPSPTGFMHVGTARTALFNWLAARASGGKFMLRIDDTDADRNIDAAVKPIFDGLAWLGLDHDFAFRQSGRTRFYQDAADRLLASGLAVRVDNGAVLLPVNPDAVRSWTDDVGGAMKVSDDAIGKMASIVLMRGDDKVGQATYQFSSVVDDFDMGVNLIIRGVDHIANTPKQIAIWSALSKVGVARDLPRFAHVGLIFKDGKKMSKRDGAASLLNLRDDGVPADAVFNFLLRMGWGPRQDDKSTTLISRDRALQMFLDQGKMRAANSNFDEDKLAFYARRYAQKESVPASPAI